MNAKEGILLYDNKDTLLFTKAIIKNGDETETLGFSNLIGVEKLAMRPLFVEYINEHKGQQFEIELEHYKLLGKTEDAIVRPASPKEIRFIEDHIEWYSHRLQRIIDGQCRKFLITVRE